MPAENEVGSRGATEMAEEKAVAKDRAGAASARGRPRWGQRASQHRIAAPRSDPAFAALRDPKGKQRGLRSLRGCACTHVGDFLWAGDQEMSKASCALGQEFGFGTEGRDDFAPSGRRFQRQAGGAAHVDRMEYAAGLEPVTVPRSRRAAPHVPMNAMEWKQHQLVVCKINWLATKVRVDNSHDLAVLQREKGQKRGPRIAALIKAN